MKVKKFKKVGVSWLLFLFLYCSFLIFMVVLLIRLTISFAFYIYDGQFLFLWTETLIIAFKTGSVAGTVLSIGIWIKGKIVESEKFN